MKDVENEQYLTRPSLIIEVLSNSTATYDTTTKLTRYQAMPSVQEIVLVDSKQVLVLHYRRKDDFWIYTSYARLSETIHLHAIEMHLPLAQMYEHYQLPDGADSLRSLGVDD